MYGKYMGINMPEMSITCTIEGYPQDISGMLCVREGGLRSGDPDIFSAYPQTLSFICKRESVLPSRNLKGESRAQ